MSAVASVAFVRTVPKTGKVAEQAVLDDASREWLEQLRSDGAVHDEAVARLHTLLLRAARFEVARRRPTLPHPRYLSPLLWHDLLHG